MQKKLSKKPSKKIYAVFVTLRTQFIYKRLFKKHTQIRPAATLRKKIRQISRLVQLYLAPEMRQNQIYIYVIWKAFHANLMSGFFCFQQQWTFLSQLV